MSVRPYSKKIVKFVLPAIAFAVLCASFGTLVQFSFFVVIILIFSFVFPHVAGPLEKDSVDVLYYCLGVLGVALFYFSEQISEREVLLRNEISQATEIVTFLREKLENYDGYLADPATKQHFESELFIGLGNFIDRNNSRTDLCSPAAGQQYDFCTDERVIYSDATTMLTARVLSRGIGGRALPLETAKEIFKHEFVYAFDRSLSNGIDGPPLDAFAVWSLNFGGDQSGTQLSLGDFQGKIFYPLERAVSGYDGKIQDQQAELQELRNFGRIPFLAVLMSNIWPYFLLIALSMKLARTPVRIF